VTRSGQAGVGSTDLPVAKRAAAAAAIARSAVLLVFDVLALSGTDLRDRPLVERRQALERLIAGLHPYLQLVSHTSDIAIAEEWLAVLPIEGVVATRADGRYGPGRREWVKVKRQRTADCVVIGVTGDAARPSLVLGLRHPDGELHHLGVTRPIPPDQVAALAPVLEGPVDNEHAIRSRWHYDAVPAWRRVPATLVCEVAYTTLDAGRWLRQPAKFVRWRPDRLADDCDLGQLERS
jgi:ATP-dependent DNA ligase